MPTRESYKGGTWLRFPGGHRLTVTRVTVLLLLGVTRGRSLCPFSAETLEVNEGTLKRFKQRRQMTRVAAARGLFS